MRKKKNMKSIDDFNKQVGRALANYRRLNGLSRVALSVLLGGVCHQQIAKWENGSNRLSAGLFLKMHSELGISLGLGDFFKKPPARIELELVREFQKLNPKTKEIIVQVIRQIGRK